MAKWSKLILVVMGFVCANPIMGSEDNEREYLKLLYDELGVLEKQLVNRAAQMRPSTGRFVFPYQMLQRDMQLIRAGIRSHLNGPRTAPRKIEPISGNYQQNGVNH